MDSTPEQPKFRVKRYARRTVEEPDIPVFSNEDVYLGAENDSLAADYFSVVSDVVDTNRSASVAIVSDILDSAAGHSTSFVRPSPKTLPAPKPVLVNRWQGQRLSCQYRPSGSISLEPPSFAVPQVRTVPPLIVGLPSNSFALQPPPVRTKFQHRRESLSSTTLVQPFSETTDFQPTERGSVPPSGGQFSHSSTSRSLECFQSMSQAWSAAKQRLADRWFRLVSAAGIDSQVFVEMSTSALFEHHVHHSIAVFAPSTIEKYLHTFDIWTAHATALGISVFAPSVMPVTEFLHLHSKGSLGSALHWYKGLIWVAKHAGLQIFWDTLGSPLIKAYTKPSQIVARRESAPLPLSFIVMLERSILLGTISKAELLRRGCLLIAIWASLRWADIQWVSPASLQRYNDCLLGAATRTKTTNRSMPFGIISSGFLGHSEKQTWLDVWFPTFVQCLQRTRCLFPDFKPDFLIADLGPDEDQPVFQSPLSRARGVIWLRALMQGHFESCGTKLQHDSMALLGVHSAKVSFLSMARQLDLPEEWRRLQGHHRGSSSTTSIQLYSRDDVWPALQLQRSIVRQVVSGFRPVIPLSRGAAAPFHDVEVTIPPLPEMRLAGENDRPVQVSQIIQPQAHIDSDTSSSSGTASEDSEEEQHVHTSAASKEPADEIDMLFNPHSHIAHVAVFCDMSDPQCVHSEGKSFYKTACGARPSASDGGLRLTSLMPKSAKFCCRLGCRQAFAV